MIGGCGALPHAPAGRSSPCTPGTSDGRANKHNGITLYKENQASKPLSFQLPLYPGHVCDVPKLEFRNLREN